MGFRTNFCHDCCASLHQNFVPTHPHGLTVTAFPCHCKSRLAPPPWAEGLCADSLTLSDRSLAAAASNVLQDRQNDQEAVAFRVERHCAVLAIIEIVLLETCRIVIERHSE